MVASVRTVEVDRGGRARELVEVAVEQLVDGGAGARGTALLDLLHELDADDLRLLLCARTGRDDLRRVVALAGQGVEPGVHADAHAPLRSGSMLPRARTSPVPGRPSTARS